MCWCDAPSFEDADRDADDVEKTEEALKPDDCDGSRLVYQCNRRRVKC